MVGFGSGSGGSSSSSSSGRSQDLRKEDLRIVTIVEISNEFL